MTDLSDRMESRGAVAPHGEADGEDDAPGFVSLLSASAVPIADATFDDASWSKVRSLALAFLTLGQSDHLALIQETPERVLELHDLMKGTEAYSQHLQGWADAMKTVHLRTQIVANEIARIYPAMGVGPNSSPRLNLPGVGHA